MYVRQETFLVASRSVRFTVPHFKMQLTSCKGLELYLLCASVSPQPPGFVSHAHKHTGTHSDTAWTHTLVEDGAVGVVGQQVVCLAAEINNRTKKEQAPHHI